MHSTHKVAFSSFAFLIVFVLVSAVKFSNAPRHVKAVDRVQSQTTKTSMKTNHAEQQNMLRMEASYRNLPLSFEPNRGQTDPRVKFLSRAGSRTLWLTKDEAVLAVGGTSLGSTRAAKPPNRSHDHQVARSILCLKFVGANARPEIVGENKQPGIVSYFTAKPNPWLTEIPTYARVRYRSLYPGVDLVFYGNNHDLEYDLVLSPGTNPRQIHLAIQGAEKIRIDREGNLILETAAGELVQQKPRIYQHVGSVLKVVSGDYVITGKHEVGFHLANYDSRLPVVIDPVLRYSTFLGGGFDIGRSIDVDSSNRAVVVGSTCSADFPGSSGTRPRSQCAVFISKLDFTGSRLLFSAFLENVFFGVGTLDSAGNIYVTGGTTSAEFPVTPGAFQSTPKGGSESFVTKLNPTGTALIYSTFLGGSNDDQGFGIAVDPVGNAYISGITSSENFPTTSGAFQRECKLTDTGICSSAFVTKLNANGSSVLYSTFLGGHAKVAGSQGSFGLAVDGTGHAFVTGFTDASDFPTTAGSAQPVFRGGLEDAFVTELSPSGSHLIYSTYLGGTNVEFGRSITLDNLGNAFVTGNTASSNFPVKNAFQPHCALTPSGCNNAFVTKLDLNGRFVYSTFLGGGWMVTISAEGLPPRRVAKPMLLGILHRRISRSLKTPSRGCLEEPMTFSLQSSLPEGS